MKPNYTLNKGLWKHQALGVVLARERGHVFNMDMGTGKTLTTLGVAKEIGACRILNLCPKVALDVWPREIAKHVDGPMVGISMTGTRPLARRTKDAFQEIRRCEIHDRPYILSVNYEAFYREPLFKMLFEIPWDIIVCDESRKIKAPSGVQSKNVYALENLLGSRKRPLPLALDGTFLAHSMLDAFGQMRFVAPQVFGMSYFMFEKRYAIKGGFEQKQVVGFQNVEEFQERLRPWVYTVKSEEVQELPPVEDIPIVFDLDGATAKLYDQMDKEFCADVQGGMVTAKNAMVKVLRLQQITGGFLPGESESVQVGTDKLAALEELLDGIPPHEPVVIFTRFTPDLYACVGLLKNKRGTVAIVGDGNHESEQFMAGEHKNIVLNIKAGGMSIDLTRARYVIYYSIDPSLSAYMQSRKRSHRPGQERPVVNYHLVARGTVDQKIYRALARREEVIESVVEGIRRGTPDTLE